MGLLASLAGRSFAPAIFVPEDKGTRWTRYPWFAGTPPLLAGVDVRRLCQLVAPLTQPLNCKPAVASGIRCKSAGVVPASW